MHVLNITNQKLFAIRFISSFRSLVWMQFSVYLLFAGTGTFQQNQKENNCSIGIHCECRMQWSFRTNVVYPFWLVDWEKFQIVCVLGWITKTSWCPCLQNVRWLILSRSPKDFCIWTNCAWVRTFWKKQYIGSGFVVKTLYLSNPP